jgi:hypothetical protein
LGAVATSPSNGQDNNDDLVGGPLLNLPMDAVQEFQIVTNRYAADLGRSASSVINIITRSGGNTLRGTGAVFARDAAWQARAPLVQHTARVPFDRQQMSGAGGGPLRRDRAFWFAAAEYRNQDGTIVVGFRDTIARVIRPEFAPPSTMFSGRYGWTDPASTEAPSAMRDSMERKSPQARWNARSDPPLTGSMQRTAIITGWWAGQPRRRPAWSTSRT